MVELRLAFLLVSFAILSAKCEQACVNPAGKDCSWYLNCLEKNNRCGRNGYAVKYAYHYCRRYETNSKSFSPYGQQWILAVKRCLQRKLVPLHTMIPKPTCSYIKKYAFDTHVDCYVRPGLGTSFCKLPLADYLDVFRTIKGALLDEFKATTGGGLKTLISCWQNGRK